MSTLEKQEIRKNFEILDRDGDGMVCKKELF
jgi:Ca2+-binding EF-hand superfamily protein